MKTKYLLVFIFLTLGLGSCVQGDYSNISNAYIVSPNFSGPVGSQVSTFDAPTLHFQPDTVVVISDTMAFSFSDSFSKREYVQSLMFRVGTSNSYPMQVKIHVNYYDANGVYLGSFTKGTPFLFPISGIDSIAGTTTGASAVSDIYLTSPEIDLLVNARKIISTAILSDLVLSQPLLNNWNNFRVVTTVGFQVQLIIEKQEK